MELDYYTVSCQKFLCGPEPLGALHVRNPERLGIGLPSGFAQKSLEPDGSFVPTDGAARFRFGLAGHAEPCGPRGCGSAIAPDWRFERAAEMAEVCRGALRERFEVIADGELETLV